MAGIFICIYGGSCNNVWGRHVQFRKPVTLLLSEAVLCLDDRLKTDCIIYGDGDVREKKKLFQKYSILNLLVQVRYKTVLSLNSFPI